MPNIPYDPSHPAVYQPELRESLFHAGAPGGDVALATEAARLAYIRFEESPAQAQRLRVALAATGFDAPTLFNHAATDGQAFGALRADGLALLVFRGTQPDKRADLLSDADFRHSEWELGAGTVHMGFAESARGLWELIEPWLEGAAAGRKRLVVCGHSLGAAIATLLAAPARADLLLTIGSPRVGNADFVAGLLATPGLGITRIVHCCDGVTEVPPEFLGFGHAGAPTYVDRHGEVHDAPPAALIEADREAARLDYLRHDALRSGTLLARELADHAPINYIRAFWS